MALFQVLCEDCDTLHEVLCRYEERGLKRCPDCGGPFTPVISGVRLIGATPSRPIDLKKQLGRTFDSNSEYRQYLAANPGVRETDRAAMKPKIEAIQESRDRKAKAMGYRSERERLQEVKKKKLTESR